MTAQHRHRHLHHPHRPLHRVLPARSLLLLALVALVVAGLVVTALHV